MMVSRAMDLNGVCKTFRSGGCTLDNGAGEQVLICEGCQWYEEEMVVWSKLDVIKLLFEQ